MHTIKLNGVLLPPGSHILCAVSGGADSVCLLHLLHKYPGIRLSAAHYNHRLRGDESDGDEAFVRSLCADWGIPFYSGRGDVAAYARETGQSIETAARELRYAFLCATAESIGADAVATAHNANDNAETLLLRLARGSTLRGLCAIPEKRERLIRPLLAVTRAEIEAYLRENGLPHREDSSNAADEAARNRIRHHALPALESVNPGAVVAITRCMEDLRQDEDYLESEAKKAYGELFDGEALSVSGLLSLHPALQGRVLRLFAGGELQRQHRQDILKLCEGGNGELWLPGLRIRRSYDRLYIPQGENIPLPDMEISGEGEFFRGNYKITAAFFPRGREIQDSFNTFSFSSGKICGKLFLTSRREGDSIRFAHREGTRKLRRLFIDAKIPAEERDTVPVLRDEAGVLAVYGFGRSERAMPEAGEETITISFHSRLASPLGEAVSEAD